MERDASERRELLASMLDPTSQLFTLRYLLPDEPTPEPEQAGEQPEQSSVGDRAA